MRQAVVVMAYSPSPSSAERASLAQCAAVLRRRDIHLVCPESLNTAVYEEVFARHEARCLVQRFADARFKSVGAYNRWMLTTEPYERFADYDYMLLYQLDAWVFYDALDEWCAEGYDYVGAPWYSDRGELFPFAGNGGFSLRRTSTFLSLLRGDPTFVDAFAPSFLFSPVPCKTLFTTCVRRVMHIAEMSACWLSPAWYLALYRGHEDMAYTKVFSFLRRTRVAPPETAVFFSFERFPERCFKMTGGRLPFGCHAFAKYQPEFWARRIPCVDAPVAV